MRKICLAMVMCLAFSANADDLLDIKGTGQAAMKDCMDKATHVLETNKSKTFPLTDAFFTKCYEQALVDWDGPAEQKPASLAQFAFSLGVGAMAMSINNAFGEAFKEAFKEQPKSSQ